MCGFVALIDDDPRRVRVPGLLDGMLAELAHRGPDDHGSWTDPEDGVALGHRRLAVIEPSPLGRQPMVSSSGSLVLVYNGEIYNFRELGQELRGSGVVLRGESDTEVLLEACAAWGVERTLERVSGMFAFALWDRSARVLTLARDRFGEKPLYFGFVGETFLVSSELRVLSRHPEFGAELDPSSIVDYLRYACVPSPHAIYRGFSKLPPATLLSISVDDLRRPTDGAELLARARRYWSLYDVARSGSGSRRDVAETLDELDRLLRATVRSRMIADVPLGAFLSGGIDSSLVVALMQSESATPVKTFTIGFEDKAVDESATARAVAEHLGTEHLQVELTAGEARAMIPEVAGIYDEPFADSSQLPTHLVSKLARRAVTVALSGDGADELFSGYNRHVWGDRLVRYGRKVPKPLRRGLASLSRSVEAHRCDEWFASVEHLLPSRLRIGHPVTKLQKLASAFVLADPAELYRTASSCWGRPGEVVSFQVPERARAFRPDDFDSFADFSRYEDAVSYLPDDVLTKVDRASMAVSLEVRAPFLDAEVARLAFDIAPELLRRDGLGKWILRKLLERYVPPEVTVRRKHGFAIPLDAWLRGPLRGWAEDLLDPRLLERQGHLRAAPIRALWGEFLRGRSEAQSAVWCVLIFQSWLAGVGRAEVST